MKHTNRFTNKCLFCGSKWTCSVDTFEASGAKHMATCEKAQKQMSHWTGSVEGKIRSVVNSYISHREIMGVVKMTVKCDARCVGATGHNCECSCGGANHGQAVAA